MQEVSVQVAVRARPMLPKERLAGETVCVRVLPNTGQIVLGRDRVFTFDHVFSAASTQQEIYARCIEPLVQSCFEGYNATVVAYGQTGSGKTYTIGGGAMVSQGGDDDDGVIMRAIQQIFAVIQSNNGNRKFNVKVSYIEIYREELHDLVDLTLNKDIHIREDNRGNTMVVGAAEVECETADDVMTFLERGSAYRHTGSTQMNEKSSRSHSIFTILIEQRWILSLGDNSSNSRQADECSCTGDDVTDMHYKCAKFHFVDLAGSERAHRTGNVGERFKESVHINTGLLALGNVISALGDVKKKISHIPYRDSKITRLLKDSLGGNAKTLMICCVSPSSANLDESLNSLKYANRARNIKNKPIVNHDPQSSKIEVMQSEIKSLQEQLVRATTMSTFLKDGETGEDQDYSDIKKELERMCSVCSQYQMMSEEAYVQMVELRDQEFLSDYQNQRIVDWIDLMEEIRNKEESIFDKDSVENPTIRLLQKALEQCQSDLQNDAEIFLEKSEEMNCVKEKNVQLVHDNEELVERLEAMETTIERMKDELLSKQVDIDKLTNKIKDFPVERSIEGSINVSASHFPHSVRMGAKSAPIQALEERLAIKEGASRKIYTSPAGYTMDRVLDNFRARNQLVVNRWEDADDVLTVRYNDDEDADAADGGIIEMRRNVGSRRTYRVKQSHVSSSSLCDNDEKQRPPSASESLKSPVRGQRKPLNDDASVLQTSVELNRQKLKKTEVNLRQSTIKFRNLTINIKMKEQLIRQLVKNEKDAQEVNRIFLEKIQMLEKEKTSAKAELINLQKEYEVKQLQDKAMSGQLQSEFRKRMEAAKANYKSLKMKQKDTESMVGLTVNNKKVQELEMSVSNMHKQHAELKRQLKHESELQRDVKKELEQAMQLEEKERRQKKVQLLSANMKESLNNSQKYNGFSEEETSRLEEQRRWLDQELEKLLEQRKAAEELEKELMQREELLAKKESMMMEKRGIEMKALRASQLLNKDTMRVSSSNVKDEMEQLRQERNRLDEQRNILNSKASDNRNLSTQDQRKLMELEETIEAMDAALDYKNELIAEKQIELRHSIQSIPNHALSKLRFLSAAEVRFLLTRYFEKVVDLRDERRKWDQHSKELQMAAEEQRSVVLELETSLQHAAMEAERKLLLQQTDYEEKFQLMMKNLTESELSSRPKIVELEKDLFFYKTTCRDLKRQLREFGASHRSASATKLDGIDNSNENLNPAGHISDNVVTSRDHASTPRNNIATPRDNVTTPRDNVTTPRDNIATPRDDVATPRGNIATPRNNIATPRDNVATPRDKIATPRDNIATPRDNIATPRDNVATPRDNVATPRDAVTSQRDMILPPQIVTVTPRDTRAPENGPSTVLLPKGDHEGDRRLARAPPNNTPREAASNARTQRSVSACGQNNDAVEIKSNALAPPAENVCRNIQTPEDISSSSSSAKMISSDRKHLRVVNKSQKYEGHDELGQANRSDSATDPVPSQKVARHKRQSNDFHASQSPLQYVEDGEGQTRKAGLQSAAPPHGVAGFQSTSRGSDVNVRSQRTREEQDLDEEELKGQRSQLSSRRSRSSHQRKLFEESQGQGYQNLLFDSLENNG